MSVNDVVVIGAGPYGLSAAAHLRAVNGLNVRVFGEPMSFWDRQMPLGMLLRSPWAGSHLSDPKGALTLDAYRGAIGTHFGSPVPLDRFIDYGRWFQRQTVPEVDQRQVSQVESDAGGFRLKLGDGETIQARRVVVAAGIAPFAWRPEPLSNLPLNLASHSSEQKDLGQFKSKQVVVVGAGQSALESAALLHETGAKVELLVRGSEVRWLWQRPLLHTWPIEPLLYAPPDVGPAFISQVVARPNWYRRMPRNWQDKWGTRSIRPAGAGWLKPRVANVSVTIGQAIVSATPATGGRLRVKLDDGSERTVDHVLMGTGYRVDITKYPFLSKKLLASIRHVGGYPQLNAGFESSVAGLHFLGAPAAWSFGPLMRFVAGADFATRSLARGVARNN
jgi:cation diffusion facilitator CzcD-associated flavoprotein CzcO